MTVTKTNGYKYKLDCNYIELKAIDYSLSYLAKIILEDETLINMNEDDTEVTINGIPASDSKDILLVINKMLMEIEDNGYIV